VVVDRDVFAYWVEGYERAWRTAGTASLAGLFAPDVVYLHSPYAEPVVGLDALAQDWQAERESHDELFTMVAHVVAVDPTATDGPTGVARVLVRYGDPVVQEYQDLWVVIFDSEGRARRFEEWPFLPGQAWAAGRSRQI
jgi:ketosteroid isomerase-like protein